MAAGCGSLTGPNHPLARSYGRDCQACSANAEVLSVSDHLNRKSPLPIRETPSVFHQHAQRNAFCHRDARQQRKLRRSLAVSARRLFREELPDHALLVLVLDAREQLCAQLSNCFWFIERQLLIHLAAWKVTGLAAGLEDRPDVRSKSGPFCHCLDRGQRLQENERSDEKKTRNKAMPKHQLNTAPISKTRNAASVIQDK